MSRTLTAIVLAAGMGKRMKSSLPKVLHRVAGRALVAYPARAALEAGATEIVCVVSPEVQAEISATLARELPAASVRVVVQAVARGTGDAAKVGVAGVSSELVL